MEEWETDIRLGLTFAFSLMALVFMLDVVLVWVATGRQAPNIGTFTIGIALAASLGLLALIAYWMYGLVDSSYFLDRNAVVIHWGPNEQVIPIRDIERVVTGDQVGRPTRVSGGIWPGHFVGYGEVPELGPALFYATASPREQVYLVTPGLTYGVSPGDRDGFLEAIHRRLQMGPTQIVEPVSKRPGFLSWTIWQDRTGLVLIGAGHVALLALTALLFLVFPSLPPLVPLHFDAAGLPDRLDARTSILMLPLIGYLTLVVNGVLGWLLGRRDHMASYLAWGGAVFVQLLAWVAAIGILGRL